MTSMISRQGMTFFMLAVFSAMVFTALSYPEGARFMPLTVGIPGILLCLLQIGLDFRRPAAREDQDEIAEAEAKAAKLVGHDVHFEHAAVIDAPRDERETLRREVIVWLYFLCFVAGVLLFGFWVTIPVFLVVFLRERAGASWLKALTLGGVAFAIFFTVFTKVLGVALFQGVLTGMILDRIAG